VRRFYGTTRSVEATAYVTRFPQHPARSRF
jgi:hypothetical protein